MTCHFQTVAFWGVVLEQWNNIQVMNTFFANHFSPLITKATRFSPIDNEVPSLLDHIWINKIKQNVSGILNIDITDHLPTFTNLYFKNVNSNDRIKLQFRVINDENKNKFKNLILQFNWNSIKSENADLFTDNFISKLNDLYCSAFPLKTKFVSNKIITVHGSQIHLKN